MFETFKKQRGKTDAKVDRAARRSGKGSQGRDERKGERRVRKAMIPYHTGAKA